MKTAFDEAQERFTAAVERFRAAYADLDLTADERRTMNWLERWEIETITNVTNVINKARRAG